jgi:hypothetical protein
MTVKAIEMQKADNNIYDKQSGKVIREVSLYKIKCMWYNPIDCKFSEDWFIPEALINIEQLISAAQPNQSQTTPSSESQ